MTGDLSPEEVAEIDRLNPTQAARILQASVATRNGPTVERLKEELTAAREDNVRTYAELQNAKREIERLKALEHDNRQLRDHLGDLRTLIRRLD